MPAELAYGRLIEGFVYVSQKLNNNRYVLAVWWYQSGTIIDEFQARMSLSRSASDLLA